MEFWYGFILGGLFCYMLVVLRRSLAEERHRRAVSRMKMTHPSFGYHFGEDMHVRVSPQIDVPLPPRRQEG